MKILMVSPCPMHPPNQGNRARIRQLFKAIQSAGHDIDFLNVHMEEGDEARDQQFAGEGHYYTVEFSYNESPASVIRRLIKKFTDRQFYFYINNNLDDYCAQKTIDYVKKLDDVHHYDVVWVEYIFLSRIFEVIGKDRLKVLDTHDRFTDRYKLFMHDHKPYRWFSVSGQDEKSALMRADVIIAIQEEEGAVFKQLVDARRDVSVIGHQTALNKLPLKNQNKMLFLASSNPLNLKTIQYFIKDILPMVRRAIPESELIIAGSICKALNYDIEGVTTIGIVEELESAYTLADIVINPIASGTGLKIKCVEALGFHRALVTSSNGSEGLNSNHNQNFIIADDPAEFAEAIIHLMTDHRLLARIADCGYTYAQTLNDAIAEEIERVLNRKALPGQAT